MEVPTTHVSQILDQKESLWRMIIDVETWKFPLFFYFIFQKKKNPSPKIYIVAFGIVK